MNKWVNDSEYNKCSKCNKYFHLFRRKHHCRKCGCIFCYECLDNVVYYGLKTKICNICKKNKTYYEYIIEQLNKKDNFINYLKKLLENKKNTELITTNIKTTKTISTQTDFIESDNIDSIQSGNIDSIQSDNNDLIENIISSNNSEEKNIKNNFNILDYLKTLK